MAKLVLTLLRIHIEKNHQREKYNNHFCQQTTQKCRVMQEILDLYHQSWTLWGEIDQNYNF